MKSTCVQMKKEPDSDYDVTENEIKRLRGRAERMRKYRGQHRRKRKYLDKNSNRERRIRKNKKERNGRRRKVRRRKNDNRVRLFFSGLRTNETNVFLEPFPNVTFNKNKNNQSGRNEKSEQVGKISPRISEKYFLI